MVSSKHTQIQCNIPLNRVEGDLDIRVTVEDGIVVDAWSSGIMYRGFEPLLVGRSAMDSLVITPRICGICSTTHLMAAAMALDEVARVTVPDNALRLRNIALMAEHLQSDLRQSILMFMVDFANPAYRERPWFAEAERRYAPLRGESALLTVRETKKILEIVAILGGQWPHTSFMVPGGVVLNPRTTAIRQCRFILGGFRQWYEERVLGDTLEAWGEATDPEAWIEASSSRSQGDLAWFIRIARDLGLDRIGAAHGAFLSFGSLNLPRRTGVTAGGAAEQLVPAGFFHNGGLEPFHQDQVVEHTACSWYKDQEGGLHPFRGRTQPQWDGEDPGKYSWAKAPRYRDLAPETGPLAEAVVAGTPLFRELIAREGGSAFARQLARLVRPATLIPAMDAWLQELEHNPDGAVYQEPESLHTGKGSGLIQAARGALGHWVKIKNGVIDHYQIITPTAWNGSPRDSAGLRGPWEQALIGLPCQDPARPLAIGHVIRSFDPCLVCTVHAVVGQRTPERMRLG